MFIYIIKIMCIMYMNVYILYVHTVLYFVYMFMCRFSIGFPVLLNVSVLNALYIKLCLTFLHTFNDHI